MALIAVAVCAVGALPPAAAQPRFGAGVDVKIEGILDPPAGADVLGTLTVRAGKRVRKLGVTMARSSVGEGMDLFRSGELYAENLEIFGSDEALRPFRESAPGTAVRMLGRLYPRKLLVGEIEVVAGDEQGRTAPEGE